jgi:hypothetical protein
VKSTFSRLAAIASRAAAACAAALLLASCGGGGVSANPSPIVDSPTLTILPGTAVMYPGLPTTFVFSGGTGAYIIASSNQAILPVIGGVTGRSVTIVPNPVTAETQVTLTLRDTGSATPVTATVTVKPGTLNNDLTVTPSSTQPAGCAPAICSGNDAEVTVTLSQGGIPLPARGVRFTQLSGNFTFLPLASGVIEQAGAAFVTATDETGKARARIRVTALAPNQTALIQATDLASGAYRQASFAIAQYTGNTPAFFTLPSSITFTGPFEEVCASGGTASTDVSIYGGTPPYAISGGTGAFSVSPATVLANGGHFTVELFGVPPGGTPTCFEGASVGVTDATGRTISVTVNNESGAGTAPPAPVAVSPTTLNLACGTSASLVITGGATGAGASFNASSNHPGVTAVIAAATPRTVTVTRTAGDTAGPYPTTAIITVTDGNTSKTATITVPATCPVPP